MSEGPSVASLYESRSFDACGLAMGMKRNISGGSHAVIFSKIFACSAEFM